MAERQGLQAGCGARLELGVVTPGCTVSFTDLPG